MTDADRIAQLTACVKELEGDFRLALNWKDIDYKLSAYATLKPDLEAQIKLRQQAEAERDALQAQVAALRLGYAAFAGSVLEDCTCAACVLMTRTAAAATAHDQRIRAEVAERAAKIAEQASDFALTDDELKHARHVAARIRAELGTK